MSEYVRRGLDQLAEYAEIVEGDPEKAARVRARLKEDEAFFQEEELYTIKPKLELERHREREAERSHEEYETHLSAVAQEALRIEGGEFVHSTLNGVVDALKAKITYGSDPRIKSYADKTLVRQVYLAGSHIEWGAFNNNKFFGPEHSRHLLNATVAAPDFESTVPNKGWQQTVRYAAGVLPANTEVRDLQWILRGFAQISKHKSVGARVDAAKAILA